VLEADGTTAVPDPDKAPADGILTLSLRWRADACASR